MADRYVRDYPQERESDYSWPLKNDILQWLIDAAPSEDKLTIPQLVKHMMRIGNAAVLSPAGVRSPRLTNEYQR